MTIKIKAVSDQHIEFMTAEQWNEYLELIHPKSPSTSEYADICVIAGDLCPAGGDMLKAFREICSRETMVLYVPGNHDYYSKTPVEGIDQALRMIENDIFNLHVLRTGVPFLGPMGHRFIGDTMWVRPTEVMRHRRHAINDNFLIPGFWDHMPQKYEAFQKYIDSEMKASDVVVTHHLPSHQSTPPFFRKPPNDYLNPWFVCDQEDLIRERQPICWIHGHTHTRREYRIGGTRVFCNPLGYMNKVENRIGSLLPSVIEVP